MIFDEDDLPGWNMTELAHKELVGRNGFYIWDPEGEIRSNIEYAKANPLKIKQIQKKYRQSERGKATHRKYERSQKRKEGRAAWFKKWLLTPKGIAYKERRKTKYANRRRASSAAQPGTPRPRSCSEQDSQPGPESTPQPQQP